VTIFDYIKDITVTKQGNLPLEGYSPFMINRWLSFINPSVSEGISLLNSKTLLENKDLHYKAAISFFPKFSKSPRIKYIKKQKEPKDQQDHVKTQVLCLANLHEVSSREITYMEQCLEELGC
jgi:hypothetical protein